MNPAANSPACIPGLEVFLERPIDSLRNARFGLLMNQASVDRNCQTACDRFEQTFPNQLRAIFSPQHGLWCEEQANMIESAHQVHPWLNIPVHSLYSETRRPTPEMLESIDALVIDLQDVGTRVYTFAWTMVNCLQACAEQGVSVVVLDRPNPLGGLSLEGPVLDSAFRSFVGLLDIPMRHGLTLGEIARLAVRELQIDVDLHIVRCSGWQRSDLFTATRLPWLMPSPNMPSFETAVLYPGQVLLEGTNLSEGRGTTLPFQIVGAPWIEAKRLFDRLNEFSFPGLQLVPIYFRPTFDKYANQRCGGVLLRIVRPEQVRSYEFTVRLLTIVRQEWPDSFAWLPPPYEYETVKPPIDILSGNAQLRTFVDSQPNAASQYDPQFNHLVHVNATEQWQSWADVLLYASPESLS